MAGMTIPELPPIKHVKNGRYCYLVTFKNEWGPSRKDPAKKQVTARKGCTKTVGRMEGGEPFGKVIWTLEFLAEHPELKEVDTFRRVREVVKDKSGQERRFYEFTFEPHDEQVSLRQALHARTYVAGPSWVLNHLIANTPLARALREVFGLYGDHRKLLSIAYYMYLRRTSALENFWSFAENYRLPWQRPLLPGQCTELFCRITEERIDKFLKKLNAEVCRLEEKNAGGVNTYYALNATYSSTYAGEPLQQSNLLLIVNPETGVPLYYRDYAGDAPDLSTVICTLQDLMRHGINRRAVMVCDSGYASIPGIHKLYQGEISFIINLQTSLGWVRKLILEHQQDLESPDTYIPALKQYALTIKTQWSYPVNQSSGPCRRPHLRADMYVHMYFDENIRHARKQEVTRQLALIRQKVAAGREQLDERELRLAERLMRLTYDETGRLVEASANMEAIEQYLFTAGIRILISDTVDTAREALRAYVLRNSAADALACWQHDLGCSTGSCSNKTLQGRIFALFIAACVELMCKARLSHCRYKGLELPPEGDQAVMNKLEGIKAKVWGDRLYYTGITGKKRELLEALDIPLPESEVFSDLQAAEDETEPEDRFIETRVEELAERFVEMEEGSC